MTTQELNEHAPNLVQASDHAGVRTLTLNNPERLNALDTKMLLQLRQALEAADTDQTVRVVVLTGAGRGFCAGQDLQAGLTSGGNPQFQAHLEEYYNPVVTAIRQLTKPVLAAINGVAAGAGASLALACDIRLASEETRWIQSFSNLALIPDAGGTWLLPRVVGWGRAFELMALAEKLDAQQGLELGLCQQVYPAAEFADKVQRYAEALAARPAGALALTKQALNAAYANTLEQSLQLEAELQQQAGQSKEFAEGVQAFLEKRAPNWE